MGKTRSESKWMQEWVVFKIKQSGQKYFSNCWCTATSYKKNSRDYSFSTYAKVSKKLIFCTSNIHTCELVSGDKKHYIFQKNY